MAAFFCAQLTKTMIFLPIKFSLDPSLWPINYAHDALFVVVFLFPFFPVAKTLFKGLIKNNHLSNEEETGSARESAAMNERARDRERASARETVYNALHV